MARKILDPKLLTKIATAKNKPGKYIGETVSKLAHKYGVSSEAALIYLAKQSGIGTAVYQRKLDSSKQAEVRDLLAKSVPERTATARAAKQPSSPRKPASKRTSLMSATKHLLQDQGLRARCLDLLGASSRYDRAINQATLVLEDRIRKKARPPTPMTGEPLVNFAFKDEMSKTVLQVGSGQADDQRGFTQILRGIVPAFRNNTHHHVSDSFSQEEAILVVGFIDVLLRVVENSVDTRLVASSSP
ncbi:TIGR02391 family protein [Bradyrhizobium prioriisuperbiae]|uniref:TIGR02391 family protein n=1 Tax=Bradyrhizobium prioriisuperbiae TaxID=2854389 RepID=UPI0028ED07DC|nr:TIGR02391 family protein [Bradyrhizobium prioritasuperba]